DAGAVERVELALHLGSGTEARIASREPVEGRRDVARKRPARHARQRSRRRRSRHDPEKASASHVALPVARARIPPGVSLHTGKLTLIYGNIFHRHTETQASRPRAMRAVVCEQPHKLILGTRPAPVPAAGEVLMRIRRVGLCGTDYHIFAGKHPYLEYPRVMGHELAGVVEGPSGSTLKAGQVVTVNPYLACGGCIACKKGKPNCCMAIKVLGVHIDGGMCELLSVPEAAIVDASGLTLEQAAMVEFLAIGAHAVWRARPSSGARVLVVGAGPIGVATSLFARLDGAEVTIVDVRSSRLRYAQDRLGLDPVIGPPETIRAELAARTGGDMFDCV